MKKRIEEFINEILPKHVTKEKRYELQLELESHIYDRIDYYTEIGYTEEDSLEKALKDFGDDKKIQEQIKKNLENIHIPWSLADFFAKSIPITVAIILIGGTLLHIFLFEFVNIRNIIIIPLIMWLIMIALKRSKRIHHIIKSIIAVTLVVPHFIFILVGNFLWTPTYQLKVVNEKVITFYGDFYMSGNYNGCIPAPSDIGESLDADFFSIGEETIFGDDQRSTFIFEYSPTEYKKLKKKYNDNTETYSNFKYDYFFYGFNFRNIGQIYDSDGIYDSWYLIGTNDETHEIAIIVSMDSTPTVQKTFIEEDCGWRYFYFLTKF